MLHFRMLVAATAAGLAAAPTVALAQANPPAAAARAAPTRAELVATLEGNFKRVDGNGDGTLTKAEIDAAQQRAAANATAAVRTRMEQEFAKLDTDKSGQLSRAEFAAAAPTPRTPGSDTAVQRLDSNKDGKITLEEYRLPILTGFDRADTNKDGTLSDDERRAVRAQTR